MRDIDTVMHKYDLPAGASLPAAGVFAEVRDFSIQMNVVMVSVACLDMLASVHPLP